MKIGNEARELLSRKAQRSPDVYSPYDSLSHQAPQGGAAQAQPVACFRELAWSLWTYRPFIRAVRWFWHVCQAIPDAPFWLRIKAVANLMVAEDTSDHDTVRGVEWLFVSGYWRSEELKAEYMKTTTRDENPLPNLPRRSIGDVAEAGASSDAIECMMFSEFFDPMIRVIAINLRN